MRRRKRSWDGCPYKIEKEDDDIAEDIVENILGDDD